MTNSFATGTATHRGGRETNQDAVLVSEGLFAIADGLGGLQDGEMASRLALDTLDAAFAADQSVAGVLGACRDANQAVWRQANGQAGTTLTALAITSDVDAIALHAGDSRLYRFRNGHLVQLTDDHTVTAEMIRNGELSQEDAHTHPYRHILTRALGVGPDIDIDHAGVSCESGDQLVLCTDGLFNALSLDDLEVVMASEPEPQQAADTLVTSAVRREADDNVTAIVINVH